MSEATASNAPERADPLESTTENKTDASASGESQPSTTHDDAPPLPDEPVPETHPETPDEAEADQGEVVEPENGAVNPPLPNEEVPPLPNEPLPDTNNESTSAAPALPNEPVPEDDGWDFRWDYATNQYIFFNRFTGAEQLENPRLAAPAASTATQPAATADSPGAAGAPPVPEVLGYNPAIHGDYDPNAWYAKLHEPDDSAAGHRAGAPAAPDIDAIYNSQQAAFNRFTGHFQAAGEGSERHSGDAKAHRQLNSYFDVDAAANAHNGRSLKAERQSKKLSRSELKQFKEKRKAKKEVKRRAWLME